MMLVDVILATGGGGGVEHANLLLFILDVFWERRLDQTNFGMDCLLQNGVG